MLEYLKKNVNPKGRKTGDCSTRALCSKLMQEGYLADGRYYCSDECLHEVYTEEEWKKLYSDDSDEYYWTEWE